MASTVSLLRCAAADVTLDRVRDLVGQDQPESLTLEYKERFSPSLVTSIAAMANTYGGLILVGVTDRPQPDRLVGVTEATLGQIVNSCLENLEPPWEPEIIPLPLHEQRFLFVVRVHPGSAPRPILVRGAAPVRLHGRNATADRARLAQLFQEDSPRVSSAASLPRPDLSSAQHRMDVLFILRCGLFLPVDYAAAWRPLSERAIRDLGDALHDSAISRAMRGWGRELNLQSNGVFLPRGLNRARRARLVQHNVGDLVDLVLELQLPELYGVTNSELLVALDIVASTELRNQQSPIAAPNRNDEESGHWRLSVLRLRALITALVESMIDSTVVETVSGLAGIDPSLAPQPASLALRSKPDVKDLLERTGLTPMPDAGSSHGADMVADPALDLRQPADLRVQVNNWLSQIGLDAGLWGMQRLLDQPDLPPDIR